MKKISKSSLLSGTVHLLHHNRFCSYEYGAEKILSLSNIQQNVSHTAMRAVYPYVHTLKKSMLTTSCTTASVERYLSKMAVL